MVFLPDPFILLQFLVAIIVLAITPGPDMTLFVGRALSQGRRASFGCMAGASTGILIHTTLVSLGLSALLAASPTAFWMLKIFGAAYLIWLAIGAIWKGSTFNPEIGNTEKISFFRNWAAGLGINLLNPKILIFFMTFLPQFVSSHDPHAAGKMFFLGLLFLVVTLPINAQIIIVADKFAGLLKQNPRVMRVMDWMLAGVFSAFALKIISAQAR